MVSCVSECWRVGSGTYSQLLSLRESARIFLQTLLHSFKISHSNLAVHDYLVFGVFVLKKIESNGAMFPISSIESSGGTHLNRYYPLYPH